MTVGCFGLAATLLLIGTVPGLGQHRVPGVPRIAVQANQVTLDIGVLEGGLSYARRIGRGPFSIGGGLWGAWEPWNSFQRTVFQPVGGQLFLRLQAADAAQLEIGPSVLRYQWTDDCAECTGTFLGLHAAAMVGKGALWVGPTARFGAMTGGPSDPELGLMWGIQGRLRFSWGE